MIAIYHQAKTIIGLMYVGLWDLKPSYLFENNKLYQLNYLDTT